jgi:hypothetical protein
MACRENAGQQQTGEPRLPVLRRWCEAMLADVVAKTELHDGELTMGEVASVEKRRLRSALSSCGMRWSGLALSGGSDRAREPAGYLRCWTLLDVLDCWTAGLLDGGEMGGGARVLGSQLFSGAHDARLGSTRLGRTTPCRLTARWAEVGRGGQR